MDPKSLDELLFLAKQSINNFLEDLLEEKGGFKYNLLAAIILKRWNNALNMYDIQKFYIRSDAMTVTNQKFNLNAAYKTLKILWDIWDGPGSGWRVDKIEDIYINVSNYEALVGRSYIPLPTELNNSMKGLIILKIKKLNLFNSIMSDLLILKTDIVIG